MNKERLAIPSNFVGIPKLLAMIIVISIIASVVLIGMFIRQKQDESLKRFIKAEKAGVYQGVTMSPLANPNTRKHEGLWIVEVAGAGDEGVRQTWEGK